MYKHYRKLLCPVRVRLADPALGRMLLRRFGAACCEAATAVQYLTQALNCDHSATRNLLIEIGTEEWGHLELVVALARAHLESTGAREEVDPDVVLASSTRPTDPEGPAPAPSAVGRAGRLATCLRRDIAAEGRAKREYEHLLGLCADTGTKDVLHFLATRESGHVAALNGAISELRDWRPNAEMAPLEDDIGALRKQAEYWELSPFYR